MADTITISRQEYDDLIDARDANAAIAAIANGTMETFSEAETDAYLAAATPLAFYRRNRGMTQAALAHAAGISQPYLAQIESGQKSGVDVRVFVAMAKALGVRVDDIAPE